MKKTTVFTLSLLFISFVGFAQKKKTKNPELMAERQTKVMKVDLNLTEEQYQSLLKLNQEKAQTLAQRREALKAEQKTMRAEYKQSLKEILTPEQYELWMKKREEKVQKKRP